MSNSPFLNLGNWMLSYVHKTPSWNYWPPYGANGGYSVFLTVVCLKRSTIKTVSSLFAMMSL